MTVMKKMLTVNFDTCKMVYTNNPLSRVVGEEVVLKDGDRGIVYAVFEVNDWQDSLVRKAFRKCQEVSNFLDRLNLRAETMTAVAKDSSYSSLQEFNEVQLSRMASKLARKYNLQSMVL